MKKLTKKQLAAYPKYLMYLDFCAGKGTDFQNSVGYESCGLYARGLKETDAIQAMKYIESVIYDYGHEIYLADLVRKTDQTDENGYPIYETALRTRVHLSDWQKDDDGNPRAMTSKWHVCDPDHGENNDFLYRWQPVGNDPLYGYLEFINSPWKDRN